MKNYLVFHGLLLMLPAFVWSQGNDIHRKLDLILEKLGTLENRVTNLESSRKEVQSEIQQVEERMQRQVTSKALVVPEEPEEKKSFISNLRKQLQSDEDRASGPWAKKDSWAGLRRNLTRFQVRQILGDPHEVKTSLDPRIDQVYSYSGDLNADGENEEGIVNFFRDRLVSFKTPN